MNKLKFTAILAGAALALSPAHLAAQKAAKPVSFGIQLGGSWEAIEIAAILPGRTGDALGFKVGDILIEAGGKPVSQEVLQQYLQEIKEGDQLSFKVKRGGAVVELSGKAVAAPEGAPAPTGKPQG